ncbi:MAG: TetR/AcrR family transcriptional regulator [Pseudomonadota bacterium]|uniref:TetR/AcrR family transcriptional regulator n=1 Tax=Rhizorhabdus phycosphaerae TaxID=2711156 RepID=UPI0013ED7DF9|nr:TetR/AcrR family transcriptional regulator [Rhizorhabdus phycosphaerae]
MTDENVPPNSAARRTRMTREARRALILSAASEMFQKHGYAAASIDAIALASGISGPAIYRYFSRKTEILVALLESAASDAIGAIETAAGDGAMTIDLIADVLVDRALREGAVIGLLQASIIDMDEADRSQLDQVRRSLVGRLAALLAGVRSSIPADQARTHIEAALAIVGQFARRSPDAAEVDRMRPILRAVLAA